MITENGKYMLDSSKLGKIEFPFYNAFGRCGYYLPADKSVYIPVRFKFSKDKLCASIRMTGGTTIQAKLKIDITQLMSVMENAYENDASLFSQPVMKKWMQPLAEAAYQQLSDVSSDILMSGKSYKMPAFLFQRKKLIAIAGSTVFDFASKLGITLQDAKGNFLRAFHAEEDEDVSIVILNEDGQDIVLSSSAHVNTVRGNDITVSKEKNKTLKKDSASACIRIYQQYHDNFMNYFLDEEEARGGFDLEFESLFKEGE